MEMFVLRERKGETRPFKLIGRGGIEEKEGNFRQTHGRAVTLEL